MTRLKLVVAGLLVLLALLFAAQNARVVTVRFLAWQLEMSQALLLPFVLAVGAVLGALLASLLRRRR